VLGSDVAGVDRELSAFVTEGLRLGSVFTASVLEGCLSDC